MAYLELKEEGAGVWVKPFCELIHKFWCFSEQRSANL